MIIESVREGDLLIARAEARIDGVNAREFQDELEAAIGQNDHAVILDLENLFYISSAGLRMVLLTAKTLQARDARFAVCGLSDSVQEVFQISGFDKIIPIRATLDDARAEIAA